MGRLADKILELTPSVYYPLDEETGTVIADAAPGGNDAAISPGANPQGDITPVIPTGQSFAGSEYVTLPAVFFDRIQNGADWSLFFVGKFPAHNTGSFAYIGGNSFGSGSVGGRIGWSMLYDDRGQFGFNNGIRVLANFNNLTLDEVYLPNAVLDAEDHSYLLTYEASSLTLTLYVDGVFHDNSIGSRLGTGSATASRVPMLGAVNWTNGANTDGDLDLAQLALFPSVISSADAEILHEFAFIEEPLPDGFVLWTPEDMTAGLNAWLDASDGNSVTEISGAVASMIDKSPNGNDYTQGGSGQRPTLIANELNGLPVVRFDGSDDVLAAAGHINVDSVCIVMVGKVRAYTDNTYFYLQRRASNVSPFRFYGFSQGSNQFQSTEGDGTQGPIGAVDQNWHVFGNKTQGGNHEGFLDAESQHTAPTVFTGATDEAAIGAFIGIVGAGNTAVYSNFAPLDLAEIVVLDSEEERERVEGYLAWKWGLEANLPAAHPYKDRAPGEVVGSGGQITGTVTVSGQPAVRDIIALSYQKQTITPAEGDPFDQRIIVGEGASIEDGTYQISTGSFLDEVIVLALENYGVEWKPNRDHEVGDRLRPTQPNQTGYVYEITIAGNSGATEPEAWLVPTGAITTMDIGTATAQALPMFWSLAHAPVLPEAIGSVYIPGDPLWESVDLMLDFELLAGENEGVYDRSNDTRSITLAGDAAREANGNAKYGTGNLKVNGTGDAVIIPGFANLGQGDWCIDFDYRNDATPEQFARIFQTFNGDQLCGVSLIQLNATTAGLYVDNDGSGGWAHEGPTFAIAVGEYQHWRLERYNGTVSIYLNGVSQDSTTVQPRDDSAQDWILGGQSNGISRGTKGKYDNVRFTIGEGRAQGANFDPPTEAYLQRLPEGAPPEPTGPTDPLWGSVVLLIDGAAIADRSTVANAVTAFGDAAPSTAIAGAETIYFDGNGDYLEIPNTAEFSPQAPLTYEGFIWVPNEARGESQMLYSARVDAPNAGANLALTTNGQLLMYGWTQAGSTYFQTAPVSGAAALPVETLTHFAMCRDAGGKWQTWIGGALSQEATESSVIGQGETTFFIGRQRVNVDRYLKAHLTGLRWTNGVRYTEPFTPPEPPFPQAGP